MDIASTRRHEKNGPDNADSNDGQMNGDEQDGLPGGQCEPDEHQSQLGPAEEPTLVINSILKQGI